MNRIPESIREVTSYGIGNPKFAVELVMIAVVINGPLIISSGICMNCLSHEKGSATIA